MLRHHLIIAEKEYAFKEIFQDFYASQVLFATRIIKSEHDAKDIVQEVFLKIWNSNPAFKNEIAFKAYLYISTRNSCIDFIRKKKPQINSLDNAQDVESEVNEVVKEEAFRLLDKAIEALAPQSQKIIRMSMSGMSMNEIAKELKISVNTVKTLKARSYKILRDSFGEIFIMLLFPFL